MFGFVIDRLLLTGSVYELISNKIVCFVLMINSVFLNLLKVLSILCCCFSVSVTPG